MLLNAHVDIYRTELIKLLIIIIAYSYILEHRIWEFTYVTVNILAS